METSENGYLARSVNKIELYRSPTVHFFHRTVVELIRNTYASKFEKFDPSAFICKAYNVMLETAYQSHDHNVNKRCRILVLDLILSARHTEQRFGQPSKEMIRWIKQADSIITQRSDYEDFPLIPRPSYFMPKMIFLEHCALSGFVFYVHLTLTEHPQPRQLSLRLLHVLNWEEWLDKGFYIRNEKYEMRELLLEKLDGDVNLICSCCSGSFVRSTWACTLTSVRRVTILKRISKEILVLHKWGRIFDMYLQRYSDALDHVVPFDEHPELASLDEENPKGGLTARTILQRYVPKQILQEIGIESVDSEGDKYSPDTYRIRMRRADPGTTELIPYQ